MMRNNNDIDRRGAAIAGWGVLFCGIFIWLVSVPGCTSARMTAEILPAAPIALLHWEDKAAKFRSTNFDKAGELPRPPFDKDHQKVQEERDVDAYLKGEQSAVLSQKLSKHRGRLMLFWPREERLERIEAAPLGAHPLAWSADHRRLLFASAHRGAKRQIFEYNFDRQDLRTLTFGPAEHARADYVDDGQGGIVVQRSQRTDPRSPATTTLHRISADGRISSPLARNFPPGTLRSVPGPPNSATVVYEQIVLRPRSTGLSQIESFIAARALAPSAEERTIIRGREPAMTPDGQWIVFASKSSAGYRLRRMRPDGTSRVPINPGGTEERMPSVSPDGEFIAYIRSTPRSRRLAVRRFDGKDDKVLFRGGWSEFPVW